MRLFLPYGSPPRVWGRHKGLPSLARLGRFTPTCVGKTVSRTLIRHSLSVHPHVCGEDSCIASFTDSIFGSPPRVWGRRERAEIPGREIRFTPTCVGKTLYRIFKIILNSGSPPRVWGRPSTGGSRTCHRPVHPHVCGEDSSAPRILLRFDGSPPRVWGRPETRLRAQP